MLYHTKSKEEIKIRLIVIIMHRRNTSIFLRSHSPNFLQEK